MSGSLLNYSIAVPFPKTICPGNSLFSFLLINLTWSSNSIFFSSSLRLLYTPFSVQCIFHSLLLSAFFSYSHRIHFLFENVCRRFFLFYPASIRTLCPANGAPQLNQMAQVRPMELPSLLFPLLVSPSLSQEGER